MKRLIDTTGALWNRAESALRGQRAMVAMAGWSFAAAFIARASNLMALVFCARVLSQEQFGEVAIVQSTAGMFGPIAGLGLGLTVTKYLAEFRDRDPDRAGRILGLSLIATAVGALLMAVALILLAPWLATEGLATPGLRTPLIQGSGLLFFGVLETVQIGALTGFEAFSRIARLSAWNGVLSLPVVVLLARSYGTTGAIVGMTVAVALACLVNAIILRAECRDRGIRASFSGWAGEQRMLFGFSLPAYLSGLVVAPVTWTTNALLVKYGGGVAEMALFTAADRFRFLLIFVPIAVSRITVPTLSRLRAAQDVRGYRTALRWNLGLILLMTIPPALLCVVLARPLMAWFKPEFATGWPVLTVLALSAIPTVLNTQLGAILVSEDRPWARAGTDLLLAVAFLVSATWMVPLWKATGLALAFATAYASACLTLWLCLRYKPRRREETEHAAMAVGALVKTQ